MGRWSSRWRRSTARGRRPSRHRQCGRPTTLADGRRRHRLLAGRRRAGECPALAARGINVVIGTTGWQDDGSRRCARARGAAASASSRAELLARRQPLPGIARDARRLLARAAGRSAPGFTRSHHAPRRTRRRARRCDRSRDAVAGLHDADRRRVDARRLDSGHAHGRLRRPGRDDHADAHGPRSLRSSRAARSKPRGGCRAARLVHDAGRAGDRV